MLCDLFAKPHDKRGARSQGNHGEQNKENPGIGHNLATHALQKQRNANRLNNTQADGAVPRIVVDFSLPFLALLLQGFQGRNHIHQQREDNRGCNIRHNSEGKHRGPGEGAACEHIIKTQESSAAGQHRSQRTAVHARYGHMRAQPVERQHQQCKNNSAFQLRYLKCVLKGFNRFSHNITPCR